MKLKIIIHKLLQGYMGKHFSFNMAANVLNQTRWIFLVWLATQYLSVSDYGVFALITTLILTTIDLSDLGVNASTTCFAAQFFRQKKMALFYGTIFYAIKRKCINCIIAMVILVIFANQISIFLFASDKWAYLVRISSLGVAFGLLNGLNIAIFQGKSSFKLIARIAIGTFVIAGVLVGIFYFGGKWDLGGFIWLYILILGFSMGVTYWFLRRDFSLGLEYRREATKITKNLNNFSKWMVIWAVFSVLQSRIDIIMLAQMTNTTQVAFYDLAMKCTRPLMMVFVAYGQVLTPLMAGYNCIEELKGYVRGTYRFLKILSILLVTSIILAEPILMILIGDQYIKSVLPLQIILFSLIFFVWTMPYNTALNALRKPYVFSIETFLGIIITVGGNYCLLQEYGAIGAAVTFAIVQVVALILSKFFYEHHILEFR